MTSPAETTSPDLFNVHPDERLAALADAFTGSGPGVVVLRGPDRVGRADAVSDLVGEKLAEAHVADVLSSLLPDHFATLVPAPAGRGYLLLTDGDADGLEQRLDQALSEAFHYRQARELGQLERPRVVTDADPSGRLLEAWQRSGRKAGDLKPSALVRVPLSLDGDRDGR